MKKKAILFIGVMMVAVIALAKGLAVLLMGVPEVLAERDGSALDIQVVTPSSASAVYAAQELSDYAYKLTGKRMAVTTAVREHAVRIRQDDTLDENSFGIHMTAAGLEIYGGKRGVLYGVYDLLERFAGVGWYASWCEVVPALDRLEVPQSVNIFETPAIDVREALWYDVEGYSNDTILYASRLRLNGPNHWPSDKMGGNGNRFGGGLGNCHTMDILVPTSLYATHPEYFSLVNGARLKETSQRCLTNPDVLTITISNVLARIAKDPTARFFGVSQNDNQNYCQCDNCAAIDEEEGTHAGTYVRFVNAVADAVKAKYPDKIIETLAYHFTRTPPKVTRLRDNVMPCFCTIEDDFSTPIATSVYDENVSTLADLKGWAAMTDMLYIWDYAVNFSYYLRPFPNGDALQDNIKLFRDSGAITVFEEGSHNGCHSAFAELKTWLLAKWMWNPNLDKDRLLKKFFNGYYGAAGSKILSYYNELQSRQAEWSQGGVRGLTVNEDITNTVTEAEFQVRAYKTWQSALKDVEDSSVYTHNVKMGMVSAAYTLLHSSLKEINMRKVDPADELGINRPDLAQWILNTCDEDYTKNGHLVRFGESSHDQLKAKLQSIATNGLASVNGEVVIPVAFMNRWMGTLTNDTTALNGQSVYLPNTHHQWSLQYPIDSIAFDATNYTFYVHMKLIPSSTWDWRAQRSDTSSYAYWAGVFNTPDWKSQGRRQQRAEECDDQWQWVEVCTWVPKTGDYLWFGPGLFDDALACNPCHNGIYVDAFKIKRTDATSTQKEILATRGGSALDVQIVTPSSASAQYAAQELTNYVYQITGAHMAITTQARAHALRIRQVDTMDDNAFGLHMTDTGLEIYGGKRGVLYGVYDLLERYAGVGWYASWCEVVPTLDTLEVPSDVLLFEKPAIDTREALWYDAEGYYTSASRKFAARLRLNGPSHAPTEKMGGNDNRFGGSLGNCHTMQYLVPDSLYDTHPEYFSLVNGVRLKDNSQRCLTNPDVLALVISNVLARIASDPNARFFGVSQNDNQNYCTCDNCAAVDTEEGTHAGTYVRFINAVADAVKEKYPDKIIETLAYQFTRTPPKVTKLRDNVMPCFCTIEDDFSTPISTSKYAQNVSTLSDLKGWAAMTSMLYIWDYAVNFAQYLRPFPNGAALQDNIRLFRDCGAITVFEEGAHNSCHAAFAELNTWLLAKWMWNPELDKETLLNQFFNGYYGAAASIVRSYYNELQSRQASWSAKGLQPLLIYENLQNTVTDQDFQIRAMKLWKSALAAVSGDEVRTHNVKMGMVSASFALLQSHMQKLSLTEDDPAEELGSSRHELAQDILDTIAEDETKYGHKVLYSESSTDTWKANIQNIATDTLEVVDGVLTIPASKLNIWHGTLAADSTALFGQSIFMPNTHHEWSIQYPLLEHVAVDEGTTYTFSVHVKVVKNSSWTRWKQIFDSSSYAYWTGVYNYDEGYSEGDLRVRAENTNYTWEWVDVVDWEPVEGDYLWFGPGPYNDSESSNPCHNGVYVDAFRIQRQE